jgi:hypothetical protein
VHACVLVCVCVCKPGPESGLALLEVVMDTLHIDESLPAVRTLQRI